MNVDVVERIARALIGFPVSTTDVRELQFNLVAVTS